MIINNKKVTELIPYVNNARTHSDEQVIQIAASIKEFGFTNPVLIDGDNGIIAGHGRLMAAKKLGLEEVPTIELSHLSEAQRKAYILADNKLALNSGWDNDLLAIEFAELGELGFDLDLTGFSSEEIGALTPEEIPSGLTDEDSVPELPEEPVTKLGDVWLCGNHRVMCGDSTSIDAVEKLMDGNKADMVFTDPPYGMNLDTDYSGLNTTQDTFGKKESKKYSRVIGDSEKFNPRFILDFFNYCQEIFLWGADYYAELIHERESGSWVVWDKRSNDNVAETKLDKMFGSAFELCWSKYNHQRLMVRVKYSGLFGTETQDAKKRVHPTQKPIQLVEFFFGNWGKENDLVIDLFGGSGSTLIACEKTNRLNYSMELDEKYCDVIVKRWQDFTGKEATLESTGETFGVINGSR